jgi:gluconolactonase
MRSTESRSRARTTSSSTLRGGFYFTDLGKVRAHEVDRGGVYYARAGYASAIAVAAPAMTPNGVALSPDDVDPLLRRDRRRAAVGVRRHRPRPGAPRPVAVAARRPPRRRRARRATTSASTRWPSTRSAIVYVATLLHGGITIVLARRHDLPHLPLPDRYPTNLCFGGPDLRTLYVTLSGSGKLIAFDDWPVPGHRLHFSR